MYIFSVSTVKDSSRGLSRQYVIFDFISSQYPVSPIRRRTLKRLHKLNCHASIILIKVNNTHPVIIFLFLKVVSKIVELLRKLTRHSIKIIASSEYMFMERTILIKYLKI